MVERAEEFYENENDEPTEELLAAYEAGPHVVTEQLRRWPMTCDAAIRPFPNDTEVRCENAHRNAKGPIPRPESHYGTVRDYAYPGSATTIHWQEDDRRCFHGEWPGRCAESTHTDRVGCLLPSGHRGTHAY